MPNVGSGGTLRESAEKQAGRKMWIQIIKNQNQDKNFIRRMDGVNTDMDAFRRNSPRINNPDGSFSTHLIASGEKDGKEMLFPTIVQPTNSKKLAKLPIRDAYRYAVKTGENIMFNSPEQADEFATHYKEK